MNKVPPKASSRKEIRERHDATLLIDWQKEFDPEAQPLSYTNALMCHQDRGSLLNDCDVLQTMIKELELEVLVCRQEIATDKVTIRQLEDGWVEDCEKLEAKIKSLTEALSNEESRKTH